MSIARATVRFGLRSARHRLVRVTAWWHPVAAIDPAMKVSDSWAPLGATIDKVRDECRSHRINGDALASTFPCA